MGYNYILLSAAQEEYESSISWYLERSVVVAEQFIDAVDHTLSLICEHPYRWRNEYANFYEITIRKYPYSIIYTINDTKGLILVAAIHHHNRNPNRKYRTKR